MPFTLPTQVSPKLPISRFKDVDVTVFDSADFRLQKRKKAFRAKDKCLYRIVTNHRSSGSRYLIARDDNIDSLYRNEWHYISHELPALIPPGLDVNDRTLWLIAHFTKLALEQKALSINARNGRRLSVDEYDTYNNHNNKCQDITPPDSPTIHSTIVNNNDRSNNIERLTSTSSLNSDTGSELQENITTNHVSFASPVLLPTVPIIPPLQHPECDICNHNYQLRISLLQLPNNDNNNNSSQLNNNDTNNNTSVLQAPPINDIHSSSHNNNHIIQQPQITQSNTDNKQIDSTKLKPQYRHKSISEEERIDWLSKLLPLVIFVMLNFVLLAIHYADARMFTFSMIILNSTAAYTFFHYKPDLLHWKHNQQLTLPAYQPPPGSHINTVVASNAAPVNNQAVREIQLPQPSPQPQRNINNNNLPPNYVRNTSYSTSLPVKTSSSHNRSHTMISPSGARYTLPNNNSNYPMSPLSPTTPHSQSTLQSPANTIQSQQSSYRSGSHHRSQTELDNVNLSAMVNSLSIPPSPMQRKPSNNQSQSRYHNRMLSRTDETDEEHDEPAILQRAGHDESDIDNHNYDEHDEHNDHESTNNSNNKSQSKQQHRQQPKASPSSSSHDDSDKLEPGKSLHHVTSSDDTDTTNAYTTIDATTFRVRKGPNYAQNKQKEPSKPALFDLSSVDFYATPHKVNNIASFVKLPGNTHKHSSKCDKDGCSVIPYLPYTFVVHWLIPGYQPENPVWGKKVEDGEGYSVVLYYTLSDASKKMIEQACTHHDKHDDNTKCVCQPDESKLSPSLRLLHSFINDDHDEYRRRLKCIVRCCNVEDVGLSGMASKLVHQYNGTPFLIKTTSSFYSDTDGQPIDYFEIDIDTHRFSYPARLGLSGIREHIKSVISDFAFLIEGQTDDELPEQIASAAKLIKLDFNQAIHLPDKYIK